MDNKNYNAENYYTDNMFVVLSSEVLNEAKCSVYKILSVYDRIKGEKLIDFNSKYQNDTDRIINRFIDNLRESLINLETGLNETFSNKTTSDIYKNKCMLT